MFKPLSEGDSQTGYNAVYEFYPIFGTNSVKLSEELGFCRHTLFHFVKGQVSKKTSCKILKYLTDTTINDYNREIKECGEGFENAWRTYLSRYRLLQKYCDIYQTTMKYKDLPQIIKIRENTISFRYKSSKGEDVDIDVKNISRVDQFYPYFGTNSVAISDMTGICRKSLLNFAKGIAWDNTAEVIIECLIKVSTEKYKAEIIPYKKRMEQAWKDYLSRKRLLIEFYELYGIENEIPKVQQAYVVRKNFAE